MHWMGPWAPRDRGPGGVIRKRVTLGQEGSGPRSRLYLPIEHQSLRGTWLISPGVNADGPDDPRVDRFAALLASAGFVVLSPSIPDLIRLRLTEALIHDVATAFRALRQRPEVPSDRPIGVFSISVGSLAALRLACSRDLGPAVSGVIIFGGYADRELFRALILGDRTRGQDRPEDPLNQALAYMTLIDHIPGAPADPSLLLSTWRRYLITAWTRDDWKHPDDTGHIDFAHELARDLPDEQRELFLTGCGARAGGFPLCEAAFDAPGHPYRFLEPLEHLERLACPVHMIHGTGDEIIPFDQMGRLARAIPAGLGRCYPLGTYSHSAAGSLRDLVHGLGSGLGAGFLSQLRASAGAVQSEARSYRGILTAIMRCAAA